jgi:ABC-type Zn2+ transport system substrate-binding protein/surface adhesin
LSLKLKSSLTALLAAQGLYYDVEITTEIEAEYVEKVAQKIHEYEMETAAILLLESSKPLVWVGGEMGRFFITPFVPIISDKWGVTSEKFFLVFEKRENIEKLLKRIEQLAEEADDKKRAEKKAAKEKEKQEEAEKKEAVSTPTSGAAQSDADKKGWRKHLPF